MTKQIHDYTAANTVDAAADYLLIDPASSGVYKKISRNTLLGLSSAPVGLTDSQTISNKVYNNTNSFTAKDGSLTIQNTADITKQAVFSAASITAGQTRTFTFPDASGTLATIAGTQTLTNKTITSPAITGGTIDNSAITVDSISGHTSSTIVTVAGLQISSGVLNTANAVTATSIADGAIQPKALTSGTGAGWAYSSYTPTFSNLTIGNGTLACRYQQTGKTVHVRFDFVFGSTSSISGSVIFALPLASVSSYRAGLTSLGTVNYNHPGGNQYPGNIQWVSTTTAAFLYWDSSGASTTIAGLSSSLPFSWTNLDSISGEFTFEAA